MKATESDLVAMIRVTLGDHCASVADTERTHDDAMLVSLTDGSRFRVTVYPV